MKIGGGISGLGLLEQIATSRRAYNIRTLLSHGSGGPGLRSSWLWGRAPSQGSQGGPSCLFQPPGLLVAASVQPLPLSSFSSSSVHLRSLSAFPS